MVVTMSTLSSLQHLSALQYPWHAKRARPTKMLRSSTPCSSSHNSVTRVTSPVDKESLRRQIVGFAVKRDTQVEEGQSQERKGSATTRSTGSTVKKNGDLRSLGPDVVENGLKSERSRVRPFTPPIHVRTNGHVTQETILKMPHAETQEATQVSTRRTKTATFSTEKRSAPKIVRFRMDEFKIGNTRAPIVTITDTVGSNTGGTDSKVSFSPVGEVRGNAISVRKEGLKGLLAYKDLCTENERRQNSLHNSMKLVKRRVRLNEERFIQPNDSTTEDYVISARSPFGEPPQTSAMAEDQPTQRPISSHDHVRLLRSALHTKHHGGNAVVKQSDNYDTGESSKNIKCSYRLPENLNWGKEVSFKDIKDDAIPNVKTYVLQEDGVPNAKFRKNNVETSVTLNTHNLNVHNSITQVNGQKIKVGDSEVSFDPRFLDWLEDSFTNIKLHKTLTFTSDDTLECPTPPVIKRKVTAKT